MNRETDTNLLLHDAVSVQATDKLFSPSCLLIPSTLHDAVLQKRFRPERRSAIYLIYDVIAQKCTRRNGKWTKISDRRFVEVVRNHTRKSAEKRWLEDNGFIEIKKFAAKDGVLKNSKIPGRLCQRYRIVEQEGDCLWANLWKRQQVWIPSTANDAYCQHTRRVLSHVRVNAELASRMCSGEAEYSSLPLPRRMSIVHCARTLEMRGGNVHRGLRVNRLYSPWTSAPRELRRACSLCGEPIVTIDLQASQPTLIGLMAHDDQFSEACLHDDLYRDVCNLFDISREEAKPIFLSYVYGPNRSEKTRNKQALRVQQYVAERFPKTHAFIMDSKSSNYRQFARRLQDAEAEIFLDGLLATLIEKDVPALTVHDSVSVPQSHLATTLAVASEILGRKMKGKGRLKICGGGEETEVDL